MSAARSLCLTCRGFGEVATDGGTAERLRYDLQPVPEPCDRCGSIDGYRA